MKQTQTIMGMPVILEIADKNANQKIFDEIFSYFKYVDEKFSTYKTTSEISAINRGELKLSECSPDMKMILSLAEETKKLTRGFFDVMNNKICDPSGIVKGWAIHQAAEILRKNGFKNFYVEIAGDIEVAGHKKNDTLWAIGIRNPFNLDQIVKVLELDGKGIATSGTYLQGQHIYKPSDKNPIDNIVSLTVIGPNIYEADRFATAAFAMEKDGINFIESLNGFEGYMIDKNGIATMTSGFNKYASKSNA